MTKQNKTTKKLFKNQKDTTIKKALRKLGYGIKLPCLGIWVWSFTKAVNTVKNTISGGSAPSTSVPTKTTVCKKWQDCPGSFATSARGITSVDQPVLVNACCNGSCVSVNGNTGGDNCDYMLGIETVTGSPGRMDFSFS